MSVLRCGGYRRDPIDSPAWLQCDNWLKALHTDPAGAPSGGHFPIGSTTMRQMRNTVPSSDSSQEDLP
jgi:hypothetical protein